MKAETIGDEALVMADGDAVATAIADLEAGTELSIPGAGTLELREDVPFGHKFALVGIDVGDPVRKYGEVIGRATERIPPGAWVHTHNCESARGRGDLDAEAAGGERA